MPKYPYNTTSQSTSASVFWISPYYPFYNRKFKRSRYYYSLCLNILYLVEWPQLSELPGLIFIYKSKKNEFKDDHAFEEFDNEFKIRVRKFGPIFIYKSKKMSSKFGSRNSDRCSSTSPRSQTWLTGNSGRSGPEIRSDWSSSTTRGLRPTPKRDC